MLLKTQESSREIATGSLAEATPPRANCKKKRPKSFKNACEMRGEFCPTSSRFQSSCKVKDIGIDGVAFAKHAISLEDYYVSHRAAAAQMS